MPRARTLLAPAGLVLLPLVGALSATAASADTGGSLREAAPHILWTKAGAPPAARAGGTAAATPQPQTANNLIYHGGAVLHHPHVYLTFWGSQWDGLTQTSGGGVTYSAATIQNYESSFFANIGGTAWHGVQSQYCDGLTAGALDCSSATSPNQFVSNDGNLLAGVWVDDAAPAPTQIVTSGLAENVTQDPVAAEAVHAAAHFNPGGFDEEAVYFVFTPPQTAATAYGSVYCAYHTEVTNTSSPGAHGLKYSFMPYTPQQGAGCGGNSVNAADDAFGHGYLDSYTLAGGHEFEEAVTDPDAFPTQDGWNDLSTSENGDKCAYFDAANLTVGGQFWAVQPMWSNEANGGIGGCAMSRGTGSAPIPAPPSTFVPVLPNPSVPEAPGAALLLIAAPVAGVIIAGGRIARRRARGDTAA